MEPNQVCLSSTLSDPETDNEDQYVMYARGGKEQIHAPTVGRDWLKFDKIQALIRPIQALLVLMEGVELMHHMRHVGSSPLSSRIGPMQVENHSLRRELIP